MRQPCAGVVIGEAQGFFAEVARGGHQRQPVGQQHGVQRGIGQYQAHIAQARGDLLGQVVAVCHRRDQDRSGRIAELADLVRAELGQVPGRVDGGHHHRERLA